MSLFESYNQQQTQQSYVPQQRANLQTAYNQALGQRTPNWAIHLSNAMPSIAEIIAAGTTKGSFNQGRIADSLERQKNRQIAYTQALQNMEDNRVKDYVQMAKDQLNLDIANEERAYNRQQDDYKKMVEERNFNNIVKQQEIANKWKELDDINRREAAEQARIQQDIQNKRIAENDLLDRAYKQAQIDKLNRENNPEYILQQQEQAQKEAEDKANQEQMKKNQERVFTLLNNNSVSPEDAMVINNNPELYKYLKDDSGIKNKIPIIGSKKKLELDYEAILKDQNIPVTRKNIKELKKQLGL